MTDFEVALAATAAAAAAAAAAGLEVRPLQGSNILEEGETKIYLKWLNFVSMVPTDPPSRKNYFVTIYLPHEICPAH